LHRRKGKKTNADRPPERETSGKGRPGVVEPLEFLKKDRTGGLEIKKKKGHPGGKKRPDGPVVHGRKRKAKKKRGTGGGDFVLTKK